MGRQQRVVVDGISTSYLSINRGISQGTVIGPIDIKVVNPSGNLLVKYADDISLSIPVGAKLNQADSESEVKSIMEWAKNNHEFKSRENMGNVNESENRKRST